MCVAGVCERVFVCVWIGDVCVLSTVLPWLNPAPPDTAPRT